MNRRQKIIVSVTGIFLVLLLLVGLTYAYFLTQISGNEAEKSISVTTANLALVYGDGNQVITGDKILPGTTLDEKTFTVKNEGNATSDYVVLIEDVKVTYAESVNGQTAGATTTFVSNDFVYTLTCTSDGAACNGVNTETTFPINGGVIVANSIEVGKTHSYSLTVTYKDTGIDQSLDMNKSLEAKVNIADLSTMNPYSSDETLLANAIIENALSVTTQQKEDGYAELVAIPKTKVAAEVSAFNYVASDPASYTSTRSNAANYYISYASEYTINPKDGKFTLTNPTTVKYDSITDLKTIYGKYIVSPTTSASQTTANVSSIYKISSGTTDVTTSSFKYGSVVKGYKGTESELSATQDELGTSYYYRGAVQNNYVDFNNMCWRIVRIEGDGAIKLVLEDKDNTCATSNGNWDIGTGDYGYDTSYKADYENSQNRTSSMKYKFNEWFNANLTSVSSKLKATTVCIGETTNKYGDSGNLMTDAEANEMGYWYFDNYKRLYNDRSASLVCNAQGGRTSESKIYPLTADEVVFAGGKVGESNYTYYLLNDYQKTNYLYWWTLSPAYFDGNFDRAFLVNENGYVNYNYVYNDYRSLRPAVSLASGAKIASGDGSKTNAYTIQ